MGEPQRTVVSDKQNKFWAEAKEAQLYFTGIYTYLAYIFTEASTDRRQKMYTLIILVNTITNVSCALSV